MTHYVYLAAAILLVLSMANAKAAEETPADCCHAASTLEEARACGCPYEDTFVYVDGDSDDDGNTKLPDGTVPTEVSSGSTRGKRQVVSAQQPFAWWWCYMRVRTYHLWIGIYLRDYWCYGSCPGARVRSLLVNGQTVHQTRIPCKCCDFVYHPTGSATPYYCKCM